MKDAHIHGMKPAIFWPDVKMASYSIAFSVLHVFVVFLFGCFVLVDDWLLIGFMIELCIHDSSSLRQYIWYAYIIRPFKSDPMD